MSALLTMLIGLFLLETVASMPAALLEAFAAMPPLLVMAMGLKESFERA
jgi:hypothetical protein